MEPVSIFSGSGIKYSTERKRILFATVPADGHFNPLTGLAKHLVEEGYEVAWYAHEMYAEKIRALGVKHFYFIRPPKFNQHNFESYYPERSRIKSTIARFKFDFRNAYLNMANYYFEDIREIYADFPFDLMIADIMFSGTPYVKDKMNIPVIAVGIMPVMESSPELAPSGIGITPPRNMLGIIKNKVLQFFAKKLMYASLDKICIQQFENDSVELPPGSVIDLLYSKPDLVLQSGSPAFEYQRRKKNPALHFVGPLIPPVKNEHCSNSIKDLKNGFDKLILVTQGTIEKDPGKVLVPVLKTFRGSRHLVVATTGGSKTEELRKRFPESNILIMDYLPFTQVMPLADLYISNGGYGGVMMSICYRVPMIVAGEHEGKNEICSRVGYFGAGINLKTETPSPLQISNAVNRIFSTDKYQKSIQRIADEFSSYPTMELCTAHVRSLIGPATIVTRLFPEKRKEDYHYRTA